MYRISSQSVKIDFFYSFERISFRYKTQFFQYIVRALSIASKLSLRIDAAGILCAQFLIYTEKDKPSLVEYFVRWFSFRFLIWNLMNHNLVWTRWRTQWKWRKFTTERWDSDWRLRAILYKLDFSCYFTNKL